MTPHKGPHGSLERVQDARHNGTDVVVKGSWQHSHQGCEQAEAALSSLHTLVFQLLV